MDISTLEESKIIKFIWRHKYIRGFLRYKGWTYSDITADDILRLSVEKLGSGSIKVRVVFDNYDYILSETLITDPDELDRIDELGLKNEREILEKEIKELEIRLWDLGEKYKKL